ncbi:hypothetical protein [Zunongwangia sp. H14]|uniref:hypothetical protein n=1 Tax=Zunongwangia sp. H14 TaxID=3240792 RepID=UPI003563DA4C
MRRGVLAAIFLCSLLLPGCSTSRGFETKEIRQVASIPERFLPVAGIQLEDGACKSPLVDPEDGTEITIVESMSGKGYYKAPNGKYGLKGNELLRINCQTGEVLGVVRK